MESSRAIEVRELSQVGEARRAALFEAQQMGLTAVACGNVAVVVTEMATNLLKHAQRGTIVFGPGAGGGLDLLAIDAGPGMRNIAECLRDGVSTTGTGGGGLGAIQRLTNLFDIYSQADGGTVVYAGFATGESRATQGVGGGISLPKRGEQVCGDRWGFASAPDVIDLVMADGLGHGIDAGRAALAAMEVWSLSRERFGPAALLEIAHRALRATRGAAVAYTRFYRAREILAFAGLGNIGGAIVDLDRKTRHLVSYNGTVGVQAVTFREFEYPVPAAALIILFSDGLISHWDLARYPGLLHRHPAVVAGILWRDYNRGRDDVSISVLRPTGSPQSWHTS
ncbi:MAG TPA: SpoIIE family protein phosphatase [Acidiferrobacteraceae bacterium]|nr:SpoIIE family protein phosphatase [Acidiferrobacteraceae bacterium]